MIPEFLTGLAIASAMANPVLSPVAPTASGDDYVAIGYCIDDIQMQVGFGSTEELGAAIYVPKEMLSTYAGGEVVGLRIGLADYASNVRTFLIEGEDLDATPTFSTVAGEREQGWHEIKFRVPYQISDNDIVVGYFSTGLNQIGMDGQTAYENAAILNRKGQWGSIYKSAAGSGLGALCIQLLVSGGMPDAEMSLEKILTKHAEQGEPFSLRVQARNNTTNPVDNFDVKVTLSDGTTSTHHIVCPVAGAGTAEFDIPMSPIAKTGTMPVQVQLTAVNGAEDADDSNNIVTGTFKVVENGCYFPRIVVAEEATSVLCGFCPRGIMVMESMRERYPDTFIGIAVHLMDMGFDGMAHESYSDLLWYCDNTGLPNSLVNRKYEGDPLYIEVYYEKEAGQLAVAGIEFTKPLEIKDGKIEINTAVTFASDYSDAHYRLAYVLLEDDVQGYTQLNTYSGGNYGSMGGWESLPNPVKMAFNDVARGIKDLKGMEGSVPAQIVKKEKYEWSATMDVAKDVVPENLRVVAMLIDTANNDEIVQAAQIKYVDPAGIIDVEAAVADKVSYSIVGGSVVVDGADSVEVYAANGMRIANESLRPGFYMARASVGGKVSNFKIFVK